MLSMRVERACESRGQVGVGLGRRSEVGLIGL